jgi:hypothetical protein
MKKAAAQKVCGFALGLLLSVAGIQAQTPPPGAQAQPTEIAVAGGPIPIRVLVQSPADTNTELQVVCLFRSDPSNQLHGSLVELNEKLGGLLDKIRTPSLFRGALGETLLIAPPVGSLSSKRLLIIGLGDSQTFSTDRMEFVGAIVFRESVRIGAENPFFAPTVLDGGVTKFATGEVSEQFLYGFLRAMRAQQALQSAGAAPSGKIASLTFLAGAAHAMDTQRGIRRALAADSPK